MSVIDDEVGDPAVDGDDGEPDAVATSPASPPPEAPGLVAHALAVGRDRPLVDVVGFGAVYAVLQELTIGFQNESGFAAVWPAAGLAMATLVFCDRRRWPALLAGLALANVAGNVVHGQPAALVAWFAVVNVLEPALGAALAARFVRERSRSNDVAITFALGVVFAPVAAGALAAVGICLHLGTFDPYASIATGWASGDALGIAMVAPVVSTAIRYRLPSSGAELAERVASIVAVVGVATALLATSVAPAGLIGVPVLVAVLLWPALRCGPRATTQAVAGVGVVAIVATSRDVGAFARPMWDVTHRIHVIQFVVIVLMVVGVVVAETVTSLDGALGRTRVLAAELEREHARLTRANDELAEFGYVVSHDLSAPLRAIAGFGELLGRRYADRLDDRGRGYLANIDAGVGRMRAMIDDVLALATDELDDDHAPSTDLGAAAVAAFEDVRSRHGPGAALHLELDVVRFPLPPTQTERVLQNLLSNALKYGSVDGDGRVSVGSRVHDGSVELIVDDDGPGIAPERRRDAVRMFRRLHGDEIPGTGMGLAIVKRIAAARGGTVRLDDSPWGGCRVVVAVPCALDHSPREVVR